MEATKLSDVLHLHMGCECLYVEENIRGRLASIDFCTPDKEITMITIRYGDNPVDDEYTVINENSDITRIKLILQRLSSITEDDMGVIWALIGGTPHLFPGMEAMKKWMEEGEIPDESLIYGTVESALVTNYLCREGYDVFYLIDSGQAIEKAG